MSFKKTSFSLQKSSINFNGLLYYVVLILNYNKRWDSYFYSVIDILRDYFTVEILLRLFD